MTNFDSVHVTVAITPADMSPLLRPRHRDEIMGSHGEAADEITVLVPPGLGAEARARIWEALGTRPKSAGRSLLDELDPLR